MDVSSCYNRISKGKNITEIDQNVKKDKERRE